VTETDLSGSVQNTYIFFNGQRVARDDSAGAVHYYFSDHLGSHGVVVNATGTTLEQDIDYYPYGGEEHDYSTNVAQNYKFTGKERDAESGLDNFGARYDASSLGRFMTPDWAAKATAVPYAKFGDPQTLNLYAYVENAPLNRIDADGHCGDVRGGDCDGSDSAASGDSNPTGCSGGNGSPCPAAAQSANQQAQGAKRRAADPSHHHRSARPWQDRHGSFGCGGECSDEYDCGGSGRSRLLDVGVTEGRDLRVRRRPQEHKQTQQ
jgi:RHS repeat-associated protein